MPDTQVPRDQYKRPMIAHPTTGKLTPYTRASKFGEPMEDLNGIMKWKQRLTAWGVADDDRAFDLSRLSLEDDKKAIDHLCETAFTNAGGYERAAKGTHLHSLTEFVDAGDTTPELLPEDQADLDVYVEATKDFEMVLIEQFVVEDRYRVAGTFDRVIKYDGRYMIGDLKTGRSIRYGAGKIALQCGAYANGKLYDPATETRRDLPFDIDLDTALVIHLPAGEARCEIYPIDIGRAWQSGPDLVGKVKDWRKLGPKLLGAAL